MEELDESENAKRGRAYIGRGAVRLSHKPHPRKLSRPQSGLPIAECHGHRAHAWSSAPGQQWAQAIDRSGRQGRFGQGEANATSRKCGGEMALTANETDILPGIREKHNQGTCLGISSN
jgi:hypothetical protein